MSSYHLWWIKGICITIASICLLIVMAVGSYYLWIPEEIPEVVEDRVLMITIWGLLAFIGAAFSSMSIVVRKIKDL